MALDPQGSALTKIFETLRNDTELQNIMGTVRLDTPDASRDPDTPYMVHSLAGADKDMLRSDSTYYWQGYDRGDTLDDIWKIARRVKILLTEERLSTSEVDIRFSTPEIFEPVPDPTDNVKRYRGRWPVQIYNKELVEQINQR